MNRPKRRDMGGLTTFLEISGVGAVVVGIYFIAGFGWACIAGGIALIGISYLVVRR